VSFAAPLALLTLLVVPAAILAYRLLERHRAARAARWAPAALLPNMVERPAAWRRTVPLALLLVGLTLLLVGFARPRTTLSFKEQEATVVLVVDVSGSMAARDSQPTRLGAAKRLAAEFVDRLPHGYRMALVSFSDHTAVDVPPTHDLTRVRGALAALKSGPQGTALADAVWRALDLAHQVPRDANGKRPPAVVVLFSDGGQTAGRVQPQQAAQRARLLGVPIDSVALGPPDGLVLQPLKGGFTERIQVPVQATVLQALSRTSGGRFAAGVRNVDVKGIYDGLGSRTGHKRQRVEVTAAAAGGGLAFMLAGALLSGLWYRRLVP
jgi:Ca-activated chloride channel family protein